MQPPSSAPVRAAGGVLWQAPDEGPRIALVRDVGGDWALPAGVLQPGETEVEAAVRVVRDLVPGVAAPGRFLGAARSRPPGQDRLHLRTRWAFHVPGALEDEPAASWFPAADAEQAVGEADRPVLRRFLEGPAEVGRIFLLRHCEAEQWRDGDDRLRPLTAVGRDRAARMGGVVAALGVDELMSSPARRCVDTLTPAAAALGLTLTEEPLFGEQGTDRDKVVALLRERAGAGRSVLVCTHAPLIGALLERFAAERPHLLPRPARLDAGGAWCVELAGEDPVGFSYLPPPPLPEAAR